MLPAIKTLAPKKLIGKHLTTTLAGDRTFELWSGFMPRRKEIKNVIGPDLYAVQVYDASFDFKNFNVNAPFEKWATVEVNSSEDIPAGMETLNLAGGLYAVFIHKGPASDAERTFRFIFGEWLPDSEYVLDHRPHFEIIGEKYKNNHPGSEEEVWIPIKIKN